MELTLVECVTRCPVDLWCPPAWQERWSIAFGPPRPAVPSRLGRASWIGSVAIPGPTAPPLRLPCGSGLPCSGPLYPQSTTLLSIEAEVVPARPR